MRASREADERRRRLVQVCTALPEVDVSIEGIARQHLAFRVRKKTFAYYLYDHHGDGRVALWFKAPPGEQTALVGHDPRRFFVPPYLGPRGWAGLRLDLRSVDWAEIAYLVDTAYRRSAPRTLLARLDSSLAHRPAAPPERLDASDEHPPRRRGTGVRSTRVRGPGSRRRRGG